MSQHPHMTSYLRQARWFAGKGREYDVVDVVRVGTLPGPPVVTIDVVTVRYAEAEGQGDDAQDEAARTEHYQMPLVHYPEEQDRLQHAYLGPQDDEDMGPVHTYDAVHDREAMQVYLQSFAATTPEEPVSYGRLSFHRLTGYELDVEAHSTLFRGEQSNSSVAFGDDSLLKLFRRLTPGRNPDIEIHRILTESESHDVAALYGWIEAREGETIWDLGMLQQFLRTASDGWDLALASARNLFAEADLHADEVGGDFAGESHRLGATVSEVHALLREHLGTSPYDAAATAEAMRRRYAASAAAVPELAAHGEALQELFGAIAQVEGEQAQRVHGDLHLGQTLRTSRGWKLVDFEGEPLKPLAERRLPDSPWRDVAGILRSFDYAAHSVVKDMDASLAAGSQIAYRAQEWTQRNRAAFIDGYVQRRIEAGGSALTAAEQVLLDAYEADKAVYEVVYEARNRPTWLDIPLSAIDRIGETR
jgi:maltokinase